jgi:arylsulfatase A-like enzyme
LEAVGVKPEGSLKLDGVSLIPLLKGGKLADRSLYWDYPHYGNQGGAPGSAVREGKWKLIEWREDAALELFDIETDPSETKNLASEEPDVVKRLHAALKKWRKDIGAKSPTPNPGYEEKK